MRKVFEFKDGCIIYSNKGGLQRAPYDDIISIECDKPYVKFHLKSSKSFEVEMSLVEVERNLNEEFVRVNRRVIVNMKNARNIISEAKRYIIQMEKDLKYEISVRLTSTVRAAYCLYVDDL